MNQALLSNEPIIRLGVFLGVFALIAGWELVAPRRRLGLSRWLRWPNNIGITAFNTVLIRLAFPMAAVSLALLGEERGWGLLNNVDVPLWAKILVAVLALDFVIYLQHVLFHAVPALWRLHRMHHADLDFDVTTGARFHPVEIVLSMVIKFAAVAALGAPAVAVLAFEVLLNATSMFNHGNISLPASVDRVLRWIVVTPDMHRVHHSIVPRETNSNFGFNAPWWDRLFGTYRAQPEAGHEGMTIGIGQFRAPREQWLDRMLTQPVREDTGGYPLGGRERDTATESPAADARIDARLAMRVAAVGLLVAAAAGAWLLRDRIDLARLQTLVDSAGALGPVAYMALYALATVLFLPGALFGIAGGALFGPVWGSVWNLAGATIGATISFLAARYLAAGWVERRAGGVVKRLVQGVEAEGWRFVAVTRLVPFVPFNVLNYALGLTRIRLDHYILASVVCMVPGTVAYTWLGHAGKEALAGNASAVRYALLALGVLALIAFVPRLLRRRRSEQPAWVEAPDLEAQLGEGDPPLLVDVRSPDEFDGDLGHIPSALNIPVGELAQRMSDLAHARKRAIVAVCRTDKRSAKAAEMLRAAGFAKVAVLRGGMERWRAQGHAVARSSVRQAETEGVPA